MRIINVKVNTRHPYSQDSMDIMDENGSVYTLTAKQLEDVLIEDQQRCSECGDTGEITTDEEDREGHTMRGVGSAKCPCIVINKSE